MAILSKPGQCLVTSLALVSCGSWKLAKSVTIPETFSWRQLHGILGTMRWRDFTIGITCLYTGAIFYDIYRWKPANSHSVYSMLLQYLVYQYLRFASRIIDWKLKRSCKNGKQCQSNVLQKILQDAECTAYAQDQGIKVMSVDTFRRTRPLTDYTHYLPYVERMVKGEENVMFKEKTTFFAATSGTSSGKSKLYPKRIAIFQNSIRKAFTHIYGFALTSEAGKKLYKWLDFRFKAKVTEVRPGVKKGPLSSAMSSIYIPFVTAPKAAYTLTSLHQAVYVQLVFGLAEKQITMLNLGQPAHSLTMFKTLEKRWDDICLDIEIGQIHDGINLDPEIKVALEQAMIPNPDRASELRREFKKGFKNIIPRVWPEAAVIMSVASGTFELQALMFKELYAGGVPLYSLIHGSTEALMHGTNIFINSAKVLYLLFPDDVFFEFVPLEEVDQDSPTTLLAHELVPGRQYESVVTTMEGLYRYRTGDIIQVERFYYQIPVYMYIRRSDTEGVEEETDTILIQNTIFYAYYEIGDMLNVFAEKTADCSIAQAVQNAFANWPELELHQYACTESTNIQRVLGNITGDMHYVMFLEEANGHRLTDKQCIEIENELMNEADAYRIYRQRERLLPMQVLQVLPGTFTKFRELLLSLNSLSTEMQVKALRVLRRDDHLNFFLQNSLPAVFDP